MGAFCDFGELLWFSDAVLIWISLYRHDVVEFFFLVLFSELSLNAKEGLAGPAKIGGCFHAV